MEVSEKIEVISQDLKPEISENIEKPKKKALKKTYFEYCSMTSIHGMRYLVEPRPLKEKIFWLCIFAITIYCCARTIGKTLNKWIETPVIVSFSEKPNPIWQIPFPAVTICSETKRVLKTEGNMTFANFYGNLTMGNISEVLNLSRKDLNEFRTLLHICNTNLIADNVSRLSTEPIDYFEILHEMQPLSELSKRYFYFCKWFSVFGECEQLLTPTLTEEGVCYTFNGLNAADIYREDVYQHQNDNLRKKTIITNRTLQWSLENGYAAGSDVLTYPARVLAAGARAGLVMILQNYRQEVDYACRGPVQGYKVLLHSPDDVPQVSKHYGRIPMGKEILIVVRPNMINTAKGIEDYHPLKRQCFLNSERNLRFFKTYTQSNCELECLTNFTLRKCGCVKFSMPRLQKTPVCNEEQIHCYRKAEDDLVMQQFDEGMQKITFNNLEYIECHCLPACTSLDYITEISQGNFDLKELVESTGDSTFFKDYPGAQMSRLSIYFKENHFLALKRSEMYGITDFLANCGGIFGLFMGISILSVFEMIYYFSLRLWSNYVHTIAECSRSSSI